ncbi:unnamed protein product [marine sediment metagenome]|uniref:Uncharacterized protein n=1 Tax=marine sediment metagenome TaxID=412755 RepID=X1ATU5_9ZZZZ
MNDLKPFSESISTGSLDNYPRVVEYATAPSESVEAAFETLRKIYRGDKKLPSQKAVIASRKILETWKRELLISKKGDTATYKRIEAALKVKHPGSLVKSFLYNS